MKRNFPEVLKFLHDDSTLSHREFAKKCGISPSSLSRYEQGTTNPGLKLIERIGINLGYTLAVLTGEEELKVVSVKDLDRLRKKAEMPGMKKW